MNTPTKTVKLTKIGAAFKTLAEEKKAKENKIKILEEALTDLLDGQSNWYEIKRQTGLSEERCKEIENLHIRIMNHENS
jgi:hypothetical protein